MMAGGRPGRCTLLWACLLVGLVLRCPVTARPAQHRPPASLMVPRTQLDSSAPTAEEQPAPLAGRLGRPGTRQLAAAAAPPPPPQRQRQQPDGPGALANAITLPPPGAWINQFEEYIANGSLVAMQLDVVVQLVGEWRSPGAARAMLAADSNHLPLQMLGGGWLRGDASQVWRGSQGPQPPAQKHTRIYINTPITSATHSHQPSLPRCRLPLCALSPGGPAGVDRVAAGAGEPHNIHRVPAVQASRAAIINASSVVSTVGCGSVVLGRVATVAVGCTWAVAGGTMRNARHHLPSGPVMWPWPLAGSLRPITLPSLRPLPAGSPMPQRPRLWGSGMTPPVRRWRSRCIRPYRPFKKA